ncbi:MAG TPA: hypothetical protein VGV14_10995 [Rhodanobacter sp.]|nr:hypothetical protein [Rhodanobacter sp.]HEV2740738.1 hypothetical protein [Candidatus Elarobacter sp.]
MAKRSHRSLIIDSNNVSHAWGRALLDVLDHPGKTIAPLMVQIGGFDMNNPPNEDPMVRSALDQLLRQTDNWDVETVAFTIFPERYWTMARGSRTRLYEICALAVPGLKAANPAANRRGLYFERMMTFGSGPCGGNQLEWVLHQYQSRRGVRKSMFQVAIFDPSRDHVAEAQLGFPCLQQLAFVPTETGLVVNAFYPTQQLFDKAYGNYLGLSQLGMFMAGEMGVPLLSVNVMIGLAKLERIPKTDGRLRDVADLVRTSIADERCG